MQNALEGLEYAEPALIGAQDYDHVVVEGIGRSIWDGIKLKISDEYLLIPLLIHIYLIVISI